MSVEAPAGVEIDPALATAAVVAGRRPANRWLRACRPRQWAKAALVLAAPLAALAPSWALLGRGVLAVALACAVASGTYLVNDALDVEADRAHPVKCRRPVAAGEISPRSAWRWGVAVQVAACAIGFAVGIGAGLWLVAYVLLTLAYSTWLKRVAVVDVLAIAAGFVVRVMVGSALCLTPVSGWFLLAVASGATMVAVGKRRGEVHELGAAALGHRAALSVYGDGLTGVLIHGAGALQLCAFVGWATVGAGGPRLGTAWACLLVVPLVVGVSRYVQIAWRGSAARPERLLGDRPLQLVALVTAALYVAGHIAR